MRFKIVETIFFYDITNNPFKKELEKQYKDFLCADNEFHEEDIKINPNDLEICKKELIRLKPDWTPFELESGALHFFIMNRVRPTQCMQLHSAVVTVDGKAFAFSGNSGIGKSTQAFLWLQHFGKKAEILNGDHVFLKRSAIGWAAYSTPWKGKENIGGSGCAPLLAICFLAQGDKNRIRRINEKEAVPRILEQVDFPKNADDMDLQLQLIDKVVKEVPCYFLECTISDEAVRVAYKEMSKKTPEK